MRKSWLSSVQTKGLYNDICTTLHNKVLKRDNRLKLHCGFREPLHSTGDSTFKSAIGDAKEAT